MIYIIFLTSIIGVFAACSPAYAAADEMLTVNAAWVDGDLMKIQVTDKNGTESTLALRLSDYMDGAVESEYISIQAVDLDGNKSGIIQVKNPHYTKSDDKTEDIPDIMVELISPESQEPDGKPLTPDGSGTVMDNVFADNGKEIFSIKTEDENVFYLIVDRERTHDNVYLLNAVTEEDLIALAQKNGRTVTSEPVVTPTAEAATPTVPAEKNPTATIAPEPESKNKTSGSNNTAIFIILAVAGVGGLGYYFKIHKKKKQAPVSDGDEADDYSDTADDSDDDGEYKDGDDEDE